MSTAFLSNSKRGPPFHCIGYDYSHVDWDSFHDHLRDVPLENIFKFSASAAAGEPYLSYILAELFNMCLRVLFSRFLGFISSPCI